MKKKLATATLIIATCMACSKVGTEAINSATKTNSSIVFTDTLKVPITDLGTGTYLGFTGGLYPGGINSPQGQYKKDLKKFAKDIKPLNKNGNADSSSVGKICFISLGGSTSGHMMDSLKAKTLDNPATNPFLKLLNASNGAGTSSINSISDPNDPYWTHVSNIIRSSRVSYNQIQVVYLESEDSTSIVGFPARPYLFRDNLKTAIQTCKAKFRNLKLLYVLGRTTTFDVHSVQNQEPAPYYNGWAEKFLIEDQINGVAGTQYKGDSAVAPLVAWGWYQWTDGTNIPRQDGFTWQKSDTDDGLHATPEGEDTLSTRFQNFLLTDKYASIWYANHTQPGVKNGVRN